MSSSQTPSEPSYRLLLIDEDSVFRLGFKVWLNQYPDVTVVAEAEDGETALQILDHQFARPLDPVAPDPIRPANLVVLDISLGRTNLEQIQGLNLCSTLKLRYPSLPILCLSPSSEPILMAAAQQTGANGYCVKSAEPDELVAVIRRVGAGQSAWKPPEPKNIRARPEKAERGAPAPLAVFRRNLRRSGLRQIETALVEVTTELENLDLSLLDRAILAGRQRELRASRWLVTRLLATPSLIEDARPGRETAPIANPRSGNSPAISSTSPAPLTDSLPAPTPVLPSDITIIPSPEATLTNTQSVQSVAFDTLLMKIQSGLTNQTDVPLETDILREDRKRDLFYLIVRKLEEVLSELRYSQIEPLQLPLKRSAILLDLWQAILVDFFGRYYTVQVRTPTGTSEIEVVSALLQSAEIVQLAILDKIPGVTELFQHFLFQAPLSVDSIPYPVGNPESLARAELLLENLVIQVANAVMQPLLNRFANVELIKQNFYDRRLLSSREIERFRNNLSWKYRLDRVFNDPKNIFESQYRLFTLTGRGIKQTTIYAPRTEELDQLSGLPYVVTLALETRDAISPRLRSVVSFVGNGFVYVLTEVIGRGIGLIGRGILKGLGNVWQDTAKYKGRDRASR